MCLVLEAPPEQEGLQTDRRARAPTPAAGAAGHSLVQGPRLVPGPLSCCSLGPGAAQESAGGAAPRGHLMT